MAGGVKNRTQGILGVSWGKRWGVGPEAKEDFLADNCLKRAIYDFFEDFLKKVLDNLTGSGNFDSENIDRSI